MMCRVLTGITIVLGTVAFGGVAFGAPPLAFAETVRSVRRNVDQTIVEESLQLNNDIVSFGLVYDITLSKAFPAGRCGSRQWVFEIGFVPLGMRRPVLCNWYGQGFFTVLVDGENLYDRPIEWRVVRDSGQDALVEGRWKTEKGPVLVHLLLRGGDDKLLMQVVLPPENKGKRLQLKLLAYPQGFSKPWKRCMMTAVRDLPGPKPDVVLDRQKEHWALFYDAGMAGTSRARGGPCGLVYAPAQAAVRITLGPYSVQPLLTAAPGSRRITVGLWDFSTDPDLNACRNYLKTAGAEIAADVTDLAGKDWTAAALPAVHLPEVRRKRFEALLTRRMRPTPYDEADDSVKTPHIPFARPLSGGPVSLLTVTPRWGFRDLVELEERFDCSLDTIGFSTPDTVLDPRWLYLYGAYESYGYTRKNGTDVLARLREVLSRPHDVILLGNVKASIIPHALRAEIIRQVRAGRGMVLVGGQAQRLLRDVQKNLRPESWMPGGVALDVLPAFAGKEGGAGRLWDSFRLEKGRIVALKYALGGKYGLHSITPRGAWDGPDARYLYDLYQAFVAKAVLWAAGRSERVTVRMEQAPRPRLALSTAEPIEGATIECAVFDPDRQYRAVRSVRRDLSRGVTSIGLDRSLLGPGGGMRYLIVSVRAGDGGKAGGAVLGWGAFGVKAPAPVPAVTAVKVQPTMVQAGQSARITVRFSRPPGPDATVKVEVRDAWDRLLFRATPPPGRAEAGFEFPTTGAATVLHRAVCELRRRADGVLLDRRVQEFTVDIPVDLEDMHFLVWTDGANDPLAHIILEQLAAGGVDWIDNTGLTQADARRMAVWCRNAAVHRLRSIPYITRISCEAPLRRVRRPCLTDPSFRQPWLAALRDRAAGAAPYAPVAYTLGDENFLIRPKHDVCTSPTCLAGFRKFLKREYGTVAALNDAWKTTYRDFGQAFPATLSEVEEHPEWWPRWADHRRFMDTVFTQAHVAAREAVRQGDPGAIVGWDGVFGLNSWHGYDFYRLCGGCDLNEVYASRANEIEYVRSWHRPASIRGAWYNRVGNASETAAKALGWRLLFHDFNSIWYWMAYNTGPALLFPDMRPAPQFRWMMENFREMHGGIARALLHARRLDDGLAVCYSQASVHAGTLLHRTHAQAQWGFMRWIEDAGMQYRVLSTSELTDPDTLRDVNVLFLPFCAALSPAECMALRKFVEGGGVLVADSAAGILDQHCRVLESSPLDPVFGIQRQGLPKPGAVPMKVTSAKLDGECPFPAAETGLHIAGAEAWAGAGETPCLLVHRFGKGRAVYLNMTAESYESLYLSGKSAPARMLLRSLLAQVAGVRPAVRWIDSNGTGRPPLPCEVVRFCDGNVEYVCILPDHTVAGARPTEATILLPHVSEIVDVRKGQALGRGRSVNVRLTPGDPVILALLPEPPAAPRIVLRSKDVRAGILLECEIRPGGVSGGPHCFRLELVRPDGAMEPPYVQRLMVEKPAPAAFRLAFDDPPGIWRLRAVDITGARKVEVPVRVRRAGD